MLGACLSLQGQLRGLRCQQRVVRPWDGMLVAFLALQGLQRVLRQQRLPRWRLWAVLCVQEL
jgi:hypothetical protein